MDIIECHLLKVETGEQLGDWNTYKNIWDFGNVFVIFNNAKQFEETKNKNDTDLNLARDFCSTDFLSKLYGYNFLSVPSLMDVAQHLAIQCSSLYL